MNAELLKRCVRAMAETGEGTLLPLCRKIAEGERHNGHEKLAGQLDMNVKRLESQPLARNMRPLSSRPPQAAGHPGAAVFIRRLENAQLRHEMVLDEAIEQRFQRIEKEYMARERLARYGLHPVRKVLLYGPPGCGKTLGAERLAWSVGLPMLKVKIDTLISSYFGESATNLRTVFEQAHREPCVLFMDECDFIARSRDGSRDVGEVSRIVNTLLQLMEEYDAPGLLVAATNLDELLDPAIFRRFDDVFEIRLPGRTEIVRLLKTTLSAMPIDRHVCWDALADNLMGASAATIVKIAQDAAKDAILDTGSALRHEDLERSITRAYRHPIKKR